MQPYPRRRQALVVLSLSLLAITIANTSLNVALPTIRDSLDASASQQQWIVDAYLLVFTGLLLAAGSLGDRFGRRRALIGGLVVFATGSICASLSADATSLIVSRAIMGVGAAAIMPTTLSILTNIFPSDERPKAIAAWAAVSGIGIALGPITGGWLIEHADWQTVFLVNLPVVITCLARRSGARSGISGSRRSGAGPSGRRTVDRRTCRCRLGPHRGARAWLGRPGHPRRVRAGAVILAVFIAWERRTEHPMLEVDVFRNPRFSGASVAITFMFFALMGVMFLMTTYLQVVVGHSPLATGVRVLAIAAGMISATKASVPLVRRLGTKLVVVAGLVTVASAC